MSFLLTLKVMAFLVIVLHTTVTTRTLSTFTGHRLSSVLINSAATIFTFSLECHPPGWCHRGGPPLLTATPLVTPLNKTEHQLRSHLITSIKFIINKKIKQRKVRTVQQSRQSFK